MPPSLRKAELAKKDKESRAQIHHSLISSEMV